MPSRFSGLAPYTPRPSRPGQEWDAYDDCPVDPNYVPAASLKRCSPSLKP